MTMTEDRPSAEIYQFPPRGRFAVAGERDEQKPVALAQSLRVATAFGGNWYHEEAIRDAERARKS